MTKIHLSDLRQNTLKSSQKKKKKHYKNTIILVNYEQEDEVFIFENIFLWRKYILIHKMNNKWGDPSTQKAEPERSLRI